MSKTYLSLFIVVGLTTGCGNADPADLASGAEVTIEMPDGSLVTGRVAEKSPVGEPEEGGFSRRAPPPASVAPRPVEGTAPSHKEVTVPVGTTLALMLDNALASDVAKVEDAVQARLQRPVMVDGMLAIPEDSVVVGAVTSVEASGKVQGRATLAFRFDELTIASHRYEIRSDTVSYRAESTKTEDAKTIGIGAGAGAVIGGLLGGKKGAGAGAVIGGGTGTAMVLTTTGNEVTLRPGTTVEVSLTRPLILSIPMS